MSAQDFEQYHMPAVAVRCLAQTGQILKSRNRPGNVHDSKGADAFLRELIGELRGQFGRSRKLEFRTDAAFFNEKILKRLERSQSEFAIKAPFWPWLGLKEVVAGRKRWHRVSDEIDGFSIKHFIEPWNITVRIAIYRKRVRHRTAKNFQLDLFSPDDGLCLLFIHPRAPNLTSLRSAGTMPA